MAAGHQVDRSWMWHPSFSEERTDTAGLFVHFRQSLNLEASDVSQPLKIHITADTRYKLYINDQLVTFGPVKGDPALWFYDKMDIAPFLRSGVNDIRVVVLRFFHSTGNAPSFPRLPLGGLRIVTPELRKNHPGHCLSSGPAWETAIDPSTILRVDEPEDDFLHVYEKITREPGKTWSWVPVKLYEFQTSTGNAPPWNLSPRLIPQSHRETTHFIKMHNLRSTIDEAMWAGTLLSPGASESLRLPAGTIHHFDLEMKHHTTGLIKYFFERSGAEGSFLKITYSESYEEQPKLVPYLRIKSDRRNTTKSIFGPSDTYQFEGPSGYTESGEEVYAPFHFRTFRFLRVTIDVGSSDLILKRFEVEAVHYPLDVSAALVSTKSHEALWSTSIRTLKNCMHDCYEDCPFYEQLQYAMDTRSSILFTYRLSGDDRLARQAIIQLHNSFQPNIGLTCSRAPSHKKQIIPHFSLFWICMLTDHLDYFGDSSFLAHFAPAVDAVLGYFGSRVGDLGLVVSETRSGIWNFTDWANEWRPYGVPPLAEQTGISTYTNNLYAYALRHAATLVAALGRKGVAQEYLRRADEIVSALRRHCFDGDFFADSLASEADKLRDYSQQNQAWAVLSGAAQGLEAETLMRNTLHPTSSHKLVPTSISMSFYVLRALSLAGGRAYEDNFHQFWAPWHEQLSLNVTTWEEDGVSQRSDCHAWGSAPIYEFLAEVAGVRPAGPGWSSITFEPRIGLYREFKASCPLRMVEGEIMGLAHVSWETAESGDVRVSLVFEMKTPRVLPVFVKIPSLESRLMDTMSDIIFMVRGEHRSPSWEVIKPWDSEAEKSDMSEGADELPQVHES
ncbi:Six-hairpin glycosidase-like protein [Plectosphaerella plurivora]|uniref:Six-hairpin glycosidase-like protein n=1 Tax=Plectosphaerella plurivora TaxID=936078 RepID=A0A9P8VF55_9PEZI|nr:Six-hairpin glycosidase-like protein [Plectosphaerella plurivora]